MFGYRPAAYGCGGYGYGPRFAGMGPRPWRGQGRCWRYYGLAGGYPRKADLIRALEEYQKDLEQELVDVAERLKELKGTQGD